MRAAAVAATCLGLGAVALGMPHLIHSLRQGLTGLAGADPGLLAVAALAFLATCCSAAGAWHAALEGCGVRARRPDVTARYAVGSLANSLSPAPVGEAVRVALVSRLVPGDGGRGALTMTGVCATVALLRGALITILFAAATFSTGAATRWLVGLGVVGAVAAAIALLTRRHRPPERLLQLTAAARGIARSPRSAARVAGWVGASTGARVVAAAASAAALGVGRPWSAALIIVPALELATLVPLTPGNVGITSVAVTLALRHRHVALAPALSTGIALHAVETLVGITFGLGGVVALGSPALRRRLTLAVGGAAAVGAGAVLGLWVVSDLA